MSASVAAESFKTIYDKAFSVGAPKHLSPRWQVAHQEQRSPRASVGGQDSWGQDGCGATGLHAHHVL